MELYSAEEKPVISSWFAQLKYFFISLRPYQWSKNFLVFAALLFSGRVGDLPSLFHATVAFGIFCLASGAGYIINDILDREKDQFHPRKKTRPIASGRLSITTAMWGAGLAYAIAVLVSAVISPQLFFVVLGYIILTFSYSLKLKHFAIIDILIVAIGFVLRAIAGAVAIAVDISPWLLVCTLFLALFLIIGKRRNELILLEENAVNHRKNLSEYSIHFFDQAIAIVTAATIVSYALYTLSAETIAKFNTTNLIYTLPFVVGGIFRYLHLLYHKRLGDEPERILITDYGIVFSVLGWLMLVYWIIL
ncbi:MAG: decaprenyl-phosphate phosphoribosyltransferase [Calditrichaeota bacterium]|nr:MAG: decaprenyl-phosphate phosphoribosyltransferase [Calditrichota bacterium]